MSTVTLTIDNTTVQAESDDTVLTAARRAGIDIPSLCAHPDLEPTGACRLCVVQINGMRGFPTSCTTPVRDGMVVDTQAPSVVELRKNVLKLMLSGHTSPCLVCLHKELCQKYRPTTSKAGRTTRCESCAARAACEIRKLSDDHNIQDLELPVIYNNVPLERDDPFMDRDYSLCVLCGRCVRVCKRLHDKPAIDFVHRGKDARIGTAFGHDHTDTPCRFCGACVDICPNGALSDRHAKWHGDADRDTESTCTLCPLGCTMILKIKRDTVIGAAQTAFTRDARLCAIGRFVYPQVFEMPTRITAHRIQLPEGQREAAYEEAVAEAASKLTPHVGEGFVMVAHPSTTREELFVLERFTRDVMKSTHFIVVPRDTDRIQLPDTARAVFATGDLVTAHGAPEVRIISDILPSHATAEADVVFASAVLAETDGTYLAASGDIKLVHAAATAPAGLQSDWKLVVDIAARMGSDALPFSSTTDIRAAMDDADVAETPPAAPIPSPIDDVTALPRHFRGHAFTEISCALKALLHEEDVAQETTSHPETVEPDSGFTIVEKAELVPNTHSITIHAPDVAPHLKPGQFVIGMANATSERIPYTPADWDTEKGTVTVNVIEAGRSSREAALLNVGDRFAHFAGPLGLAIDVKHYGTVVLGGGCYGVGSMLPLARALKAAGNRVICIEEASSAYLLYWKDKLANACDELLIATKDGTEGIRGGVQEGIDVLVERGETIDQAFISGCTFMMMLVCECTRKHNIPTQTAMNPIMLDGTGMCGACRVTVGDETKFACVDGPYLDGHQIDWEGLMQRQIAYGLEEVQALPQEHKKEHRCMTI